MPSASERLLVHAPPPPVTTTSSPRRRRRNRGASSQQVVHEVLPRHEVCRLAPASGARPGVERYPLDAGAGPDEQGDELSGNTCSHVPPPTWRLGEQVSAGSPPGREHRQHLALSHLEHEDLQPLVPIPGHHVVQGRRTSLGDAGRKPSSLLSAEPGT